MKHEQAVVVTLSYVIGFTTAFIAFAISGNGDEYQAEFVSLERENVLPAVVQPVSADQGVRVFTKAEGLFMVKDGKERILSAVASDDSTRNGYHRDVATAEVSPNGNYIHYCANVGGDLGTCSHFVYSIAEDSVYKLKSDGVQLETTGEEIVSVVWTANDELEVDGALASQESRWHLR